MTLQIRYPRRIIAIVFTYQREIANIDVMKNRAIALAIIAKINDTVDTKKSNINLSEKN